MRLQPESEHPHGLPDSEFDSIFTTDKPIIFAFHGYPWLIHRLTYRRSNHGNLHVRGYKEEGTTTTPFDMVVRNDLDRFHLAEDVIDRAAAARRRRRLREAGARAPADRAPAVHLDARRRHAARSRAGRGAPPELTRAASTSPAWRRGAASRSSRSGSMELLSARVERLGFFRPIVPSAEPDPQLELVRGRYRLEFSYDELHALTQAEADAIDDYDELRKRVLHAYRSLAERCDFVLVEGTDFTGVAAGLAFGLNADLANELGAPVLVVVKGGTPDETVAAVHVARESLSNKGCTLFGIVVNRAPEQHVAEISARARRMRRESRSTSSASTPTSTTRRSARWRTRSARRSSSSRPGACTARCATCASAR